VSAGAGVTFLLGFLAGFVVALVAVAVIGIVRTGVL
jgi:hypothetical protein